MGYDSQASESMQEVGIASLTIGSWTKRPPLSLAAVKLTERNDIECCENAVIQDPILKVTSDFELCGDHIIARYLARSRPHFKLYGEGDEDSVARASEIDQYLAVCKNYMDANPADLHLLSEHLEAKLISRTFLVGHRLSLADVEVWILLSSSQIDLDDFPNLKRWKDLIDGNECMATLLKKSDSKATAHPP